MTAVSTTGLGLVYPSHVCERTFVGVPRTVDATGEITAVMGHIFIQGRPTSPKTISAAGGGSITFRAQSTTFAAVGPPSTVVIGIQDVSPTAGPGPQPDGAFDVSKTLTSGVDTISSNAWKTAVTQCDVRRKLNIQTERRRGT